MQSVVVSGPLQYLVHQFRTAVLSVRMFPLLSSMTADLCRWVLVRALRVFKVSLQFPDIIYFSVFALLLNRIFLCCLHLLCSLFCTLLYRPINSEQDRLKLQADLDNLLDWADTLQRKVLHLGNKNGKYNYNM